LLERASLRSDGVYLCYNAFAIYFFVGRQCDPFFINQIFKVNDVPHIDRLISEEEIFADSANSVYLTALYNIIYSFRY